MRFLIFILIFCIASSYSVACENNINAVSKCFLTAVLQQDMGKLKGIYGNEDFDETIFIGETAKGNSNLKSVYSILSKGKILVDIQDNPNGGDGSYIVAYYPETLAKSHEELARKAESGEAKMFVDYIVCEIEVTSQGSYFPHPCFLGFDFNEF